MDDELDELILEILREEGLTLPLEWIVDYLDRKTPFQVRPDHVWDRLNGALQEHGVYQTTAPTGIVYGIR